MFIKFEAEKTFSQMKFAGYSTSSQEIIQWLERRHKVSSKTDFVSLTDLSGNMISLQNTHIEPDTQIIVRRTPITQPSCTDIVV